MLIAYKNHYFQNNGSAYFDTSLNYHFLEMSMYSPSGLSYPLIGGVRTGPQTVKGSCVGLICNQKSQVAQY
jgi:hypothetical protein